MTAFVAIAAMLTLGALLFVLPPLLTRRTPSGSGVEVPLANAEVLREQLAEIDAQLASGALDPTEHAAVRAEIRQRVLEAAPTSPAPVPEDQRRRWLPWLIGAGLPAGVVLVYLLVGNPAGIDPPAAPAAGAQHALNKDQIAAMVERLATRLRSQPDDFDGWTMLARSRAALGQYGASAEAWARASGLRPQDAQLMAEWADMRAMAQGRRLAGEPEAILARALALDPANPKGLALAGSAAFEKGDYRQAIALWRKLAVVAPEGSEFTRSVQASIADAQRKLAESAAGGAAPAGAAPSAGAIQGRIVLAPELAQQARPGDTLFVIARPADGGRVPLAVHKQAWQAGTVEFRLDDSQSMNPAAPLSAAGKVVLVARLSRSGAPVAASGDLEGSMGPVSPGTAGLELRIDRRVP